VPYSNSVGRTRPAAPGAPADRPLQLRDCLGQFATGVTIVTVAHDNGIHGATVNSFTSVSLDPALVLVSLDRRSLLCERLAGSPFGVNILAADQQDVGLHFAGLRRTDGARLEWETSWSVPRLRGCAGFIACLPWTSYEGGDHILHIGEVKHFEVYDSEPLVFHRGTFRGLGRISDEHAWRGSLDGPADGRWQTNRDQTKIGQA
jgi:flavin reductase (DIM6/NTAB) family NADH-FMN oxidoreductase RutF